MDDFRLPHHDDSDMPDGGAPADLAPPGLRHLVDAVLDDAESIEDQLDACDAYVVLVFDPATGAIDSYGPFDGTTALLDAARRRRGLDEGDLTDVAVTVVRHHMPEAGENGAHAIAS
ncbi:hypothetical protein LQ327_02210 [Actinomycetospora endophytica]|uniref:Uncharacterized protein n=1 Tax=Actinomycetospora endophytica TaxID=2291215 RepID=A0ABS8P2B6_9PSEU|nr:hypothetical protein [Actinomycetospora endophytica]MCD2192208.1 hypothetical protein [Actinomycetospora endophytica]